MTGTADDARPRLDERSPCRRRTPGNTASTSRAQPNPSIRATNGTSAWAVGGGGVAAAAGTPNAARDLAGFQMQQGLRLADFALPLRLKARYTTLLVNKAYETINGRPVVVITGTPYPNVTEQLSFDRETGCCCGAWSPPSGGTGFNILNLPEQIDYSDYRDVGGIKVPHTVRHATYNQVTTLKFTDVKINAPVADDVFVKPAPK